MASSAQSDALILGDAARRTMLIGARRRATGLLIAVAAALAALVVATDETAGWVGYLTAGLQAAMVGGLADWFAVTALFRRPLRLPIPHTAVIQERKDGFGQTLGSFVQDELLTPDAIAERVRRARVTERTADWLSEPANASRTAHQLADAAVTVADLLRDDEVHHALEEALRNRIEAIPLAPLAGRALDLLTDGGRHQEVLDVVLRAADKALRDHQDDLRRRLSTESPWWLPDAVEDRIFERLIDGGHRLIHEIARDADHPLRLDFDQRVRDLAEQLQTSEALRERGEALKHDLLGHPELRQWTATVWRDLKAGLRSQADDPDSEVRRRLAVSIASVGQRLRVDPVLAARVDDSLERAVAHLSAQFHDEVGSMVTTTIARWDAHEASTRLELLLGPDLQFIRINGTLVGGLAGLLIHAVAQALG